MQFRANGPGREQLEKIGKIKLLTANRDGHGIHFFVLLLLLSLRFCFKLSFLSIWFVFFTIKTSVWPIGAVVRFFVSYILRKLFSDSDESQKKFKNA